MLTSGITTSTAGIDMHKEFLMVTVLDEEGSEVVSPRRIPTSGLSIQEFFGKFEPEDIIC